MNNIIAWIKNMTLVFTLIASCLSGALGISQNPNIPPDNNYPLGQPLQISEKNLIWPDEQIFPSFSEPDGELIAFPGDLLSESETVALACLQGFANAVKTRMVILDSDVSKWISDYGYSFVKVTGSDAYEKIKELSKDSVSGVVLYSDELSEHYMNLASSIGNTMNAIPLTEEDYEKWLDEGIELPVVADIRGMKYKTATEIYKYFFDYYWENCNKKILVVQRPGLKFQMRDLASAVGGAVVYLSCGGGPETMIFKQYLGDMTPGKSIVTGWYADQERELMTVCGKSGLSCVPADFFSNATVFAQKKEIAVPKVPDMPELENKIYIAYFLSDGDNIQYDMHAMREYWDNNSSQRGKVPVNWTISPALVDIAPGMMNYYYSQATDKECFVCGPSGMGYTMPKNTYGANLGNQFPDCRKFTSYVDMTNNYLQKAGLRAVTIWDNLSLAQRNVYTSVGTYLYGLTVQHFTDSSLRRLYTGVTNNMLIMQMTPGYFAQNAEGNHPLTKIGDIINDAVKYLKYNGKASVFVATQVSVWGYHNIGDVADLEKYLSDYYEAIYGKDVVEFVRADHFYNLYYEANKLPQDVTLKAELTAAATSSSEKASLTTDGTCCGDSIWTASEEGMQSVTYSLGKNYNINEIALYHAETGGLDASLNTKSFIVEVSGDGTNWIKAAEVSGNTDSWTDVQFKAVKGRYVRITINDAGGDNIARIADIDIYGTLVK